MDITTNGEIKNGSTKLKKIGEEKQTFFQLKYICPISEPHFTELAGNGAKSAYEITPFPFKKICFDGLKNVVKIKVTQLDEDGDDLGDEKEFTDVIISKFDFINSANLPTLAIDFLIPTSKNLVESLVNMVGNARIEIK